MSSETESTQFFLRRATIGTKMFMKSATRASIDQAAISVFEGVWDGGFDGDDKDRLYIRRTYMHVVV